MIIFICVAVVMSAVILFWIVSLRWTVREIQSEKTEEPLFTKIGESVRNFTQEFNRTRTKISPQP